MGLDCLGDLIVNVTSYIKLMKKITYTSGFVFDCNTCMSAAAFSKHSSYSSAALLLKVMALPVWKDIY